jgi:hypothetical protein
VEISNAAASVIMGLWFSGSWIFGLVILMLRINGCVFLVSRELTFTATPEKTAHGCPFKKMFNVG